MLYKAVLFCWSAGLLLLLVAAQDCPAGKYGDDCQSECYCSPDHCNSTSGCDGGCSFFQKGEKCLELDNVAIAIVSVSSAVFMGCCIGFVVWITQRRKCKSRTMKKNYTIVDPVPDKSNVCAFNITMFTLPTAVKRKVVIDTDAGIDDAQAILMALAASKTMDVVGITTVHGNSSCDNVTLNVLRLLKLAGRLDIPVFKGAYKPYKSCAKRIDSSYYHGKDGFGDQPDPKAPGVDQAQKESAYLALQRLAKTYPGELEVLCIGPLTNIAHVVDKDPKFGSKIKQCYIMGGNYKGEGNITPHAEFNFYADPEAANIALTRLRCNITMTCWELVRSCPFDLKWYNSTYLKGQNPIATFIKTIEANTILKFYKEPKFKKTGYETPDQMAVAMALNPDMIKDSRSCSAYVECKDKKTRGRMNVDWNSSTSNIKVVTEIDRKVYTCMLEAYLAVNESRDGPTKPAKHVV